MEKAIFTGAKPGDRPLKFLPVSSSDIGKGGGNHQRLVRRGVIQEIGKAAGVMKYCFGRH